MTSGFVKLVLHQAGCFSREIQTDCQFRFLQSFFCCSNFYCQDFLQTSKRMTRWRFWLQSSNLSPSSVFCSSSSSISSPPPSLSFLSLQRLKFKWNNTAAGSNSARCAWTIKLLLSSPAPFGNRSRTDRRTEWNRRPTKFFLQFFFFKSTHLRKSWCKHFSLETFYCCCKQAKIRKETGNVSNLQNKWLVKETKIFIP